MRTWLVVDLGGVAAHFIPDRRLAALSDLTNMTIAEIQFRLFDSGLDRAAELGLHSKDSIIDAIITALDGSLSFDQLISAWALAFEPNHDVLRWVSNHDARTCLFTNNGPMLDLCLDGPLSELAKPFTRVVCSWHARAAKPAQEAFAYVESTLAVSPEQLLLIDDDIRNTRTAAARGWQTHHFTSFSALQDPTKS